MTVWALDKWPVFLVPSVGGFVGGALALYLSTKLQELSRWLWTWNFGTFLSSGLVSRPDLPSDLPGLVMPSSEETLMVVRGESATANPKSLGSGI